MKYLFTSRRQRLTSVSLRLSLNPVVGAMPYENELARLLLALLLFVLLLLLDEADEAADDSDPRRFSSQYRSLKDWKTT
jgi:hypothetical protein